MIIFCDFDGTLVDVKYRYQEVASTGLEEMGKGRIPANYFRMKQNNLSEKKIFPIFTDNEYNFYEKKRREMLESPDFLKFDKLILGAKQFLMSLQTHSIVLVSMRRKRKLLLKELESLKISHSFTDVITPPPLYKDALKAKTEIIRHSNYFHPERSIIIGDTEIDYLAAKELAIPAIIITHGMRSRDFLSKHYPLSGLVDNYDQALDLLSTYN
jgi:phosphoglycolate phosphatase